MKKYTISFLCIIVVALILIASRNYMTDKTGILNPGNMGEGVEPTQHFVKMRYILDNPLKYNAFLFGSSRVGNCDSSIINDDLNYYNMTYSEGVPEEWLTDIKMFLTAGVKPKRIMLAIDDFSFRVDPLKHEHEMLRLPYKENNTRTYLSVLLKRPALKYKAQDNRVVFNIFANGQPAHSFTDENIDKDYLQRLQNGMFDKSSSYKGNRIFQTIDALREIKSIAAQNDIELIVWFNPIHHLTYLDNNLIELNEFKRELASVCEFWDFSGINRITNDDYYWYETSHYRVIVGDMILARVLNLPVKKEGFGVFVNYNNIEKHLYDITQK